MTPVKTSRAARVTCSSPADNYLAAKAQVPVPGWVAPESLLRKNKERTSHFHLQSLVGCSSVRTRRHTDRQKINQLASFPLFRRTVEKLSSTFLWVGAQGFPIWWGNSIWWQRSCEWVFHTSCSRVHAGQQGQGCGATVTTHFCFCKEFFSKKCRGKLSCSEEEINTYNRRIYSDPRWNQYLGPCKALVDPPEWSKQFDCMHSH